MAIRKRRTFPGMARSTSLLGWLIGGVLLWCAGGALATARNPLEPIDTSSPRSTLQGFMHADAVDAKTAEPFKQWTSGHAEPLFALLEQKPQLGEYLFTAEMASRIPEFPNAVRARQYLDFVSTGSHGILDYGSVERESVSFQVIASRDFPAWAQTRIVGEPLWRWLGTCFVLIAGFVIIVWSFLISRRWAGGKSLIGRWSGLLRPLSLVVVTPALAMIIADVLRVPGAVGRGLTLPLWTVFFVALSWLVWVSGTLGAENFIRTERLRPGSIDSRIVRLLMRVVSTVLAMAILVEGAYMVVVHSMPPGSGAGSAGVPAESTRLEQGN